MLVQSNLTSIPAYLMGVIKLPSTLINSQLANCFWDDYEGHHKYHLTSWGTVALKKEYGGLGITNIAGMNLCLLASWAKRYFSGDNKMETYY